MRLEEPSRLTFSLMHMLCSRAKWGVRKKEGQKTYCNADDPLNASVRWGHTSLCTSFTDHVCTLHSPVGKQGPPHEPYSYKGSFLPPAQTVRVVSECDYSKRSCSSNLLLNQHQHHLTLGRKRRKGENAICVYVCWYYHISCNFPSGQGFEKKHHIRSKVAS